MNFFIDSSSGLLAAANRKARAHYSGSSGHVRRDGVDHNSKRFPILKGTGPSKHQATDTALPPSDLGFPKKHLIKNGSEKRVYGHSVIG